MISIIGGDQLNNDYATLINKESEKDESTFYLIRHAEAEINLLDIVGGRSNHSPLTPNGNNQASKLGGRLDKIEFDYVLCSPSLRTKQTMEISLGKRKLETKFLDDLQELSQGEWEGKPRKEIYSGERIVQISKDNWNFCPPGGESQSRVANRIRWTLESEAVKRPGKYFVYTHGGAIKYFLAEVFNLPKTKIWNVPIDNTSITKLKYNQGFWKLEYQNDFSHLS